MGKMSKRNLIKIFLIALSVVAIIVTSLCLIVFAESGDAGLDIAYSNLSFENEIHLLYAIESDEENVKLLVWNEPQDEYILGTQKATLYPAKRDYEINGVKHTIFEYDGLAAKNMADNVYVRACITNGDATTYGNVDKYSILQYAYNKLGKTDTASTNENLKSMLSSMLEYGANAQKYFNYKTDRLANADWVQIKLNGGVLTDGFTHGLYLSGDSVTITAPESIDQGVFTCWENKSGTQIATSPTHNLTVDNENQTYTAKYGTYSQGLAFTSNGDGTCYVFGIGTCTDTDISIPPVSPYGDSVTYIVNSAFRSCSNLESITIPNSVTSIGSHAFYSCSNLESITIPNSVTSIGSYAFDGCTSLTSITIPKGVTSIEVYLFSGCSSLTSIEIPDSVTSIGNAAFSGCSDLTSITIPDSVTSIGRYAFWNCTSLQSITIPDSVTSIGEWAFLNCSSLQAVYITDIASWCNIDFEHNSSNPLYNTDNLYLNGTLVTDLIIPNTVTSIGSYAFAGCTSLTSINIPDSVTNIGEWAFYGCSSLTSITIPKGVTSIEDHLFRGCSSLTSIEIPDSVTSIGSHAFCGCTSLTSITIPDSVTSIGYGAFSGCSSLTSITIPSGVTSIGDYAFFDCSSLTSITIPSGVTSIGDYAFFDCSSLTSIVFHGAVEQWNGISKGTSWNSNTGDYTIYCTDGTIAKDGTITYN